MKRDNITLKAYFETGDYPTEAQFSDLIDSFLNIEEEDAVTGITNNGDGTYTFQLLSGGNEVIDVGNLAGDITIASVVGLQAALDSYVNLSSNQTVSGEKIWNNSHQFNGRIGIGNFPFGPNRLGDAVLQAPDIDTQAINWKNSSQETLAAIFMNPSGTVMTIKGFDDSVMVTDFTSKAGVEGVDSHESTIANTIEHTNGAIFINDQGVQSYPGATTPVANAFFQVLQNRNGGSRKPYWFGYYDGTTYDTIWEIDTNGVVTFNQVTKGKDGVSPEDFVTKAQLDAIGGGSGGLGGSISENQIVTGNTTGNAQGTDDFKFDGENLILTGSNTDRFLRFAETTGQYNGAFFWYEGATNKLHIGAHSTNDTDKANDQKSFTIQRSNGFVGLFNDNPSYELDITGTLNTSGARIAPTFANFTNRLAVGNPSFGGSRLGDSALQSPSIDTTAINFMADTGQTVNFAIFENNNVMTIRSLGVDKLGVLDFNGAHQADYNNDSAEATVASTLRYDNGYGYVNDVGVQRYLPGISVIAQSFFDVLINSGGAPRMKHVKTYYDGSTYDVIRTIEVDGRMVHEKVVEFKQPTIGIAAVNDNEFVTKDQMNNAVSAIESGTSATRPTTGIVAGSHFFDTTLGKPIWYNGSNWVDALGVSV